MSVFDKELIINGEAVRSPEQQVYKNMKDIKVLKGKIKDVFKTTATLTSSSVSVALVDTNVTDEEEGWLMSEDGLLFAITGNDGTNLLISYYADLKGPQGDPGAALNIDDSTTSATKVWSSQKTNNEINKNSDKGLYITFTDATAELPPSIYYNINISDIDNINSNINIKGEDLIIYIDSSYKPQKIYKVVGTGSSVLTVEQIAIFSSGKQLYQHNIQHGNSSTFNIHIQIINSKSTAMTISDLYNFLVDNGFKGLGGNLYDKCYQATGITSSTNVFGVCAKSDETNKILVNGSPNNSFTTFDDDIVIPL